MNDILYESVGANGAKAKYDAIHEAKKAEKKLNKYDFSKKLERCRNDKQKKKVYDKYEAMINDKNAAKNYEAKKDPNSPAYNGSRHGELTRAVKVAEKHKLRDAFDGFFAGDYYKTPLGKAEKELKDNTADAKDRAQMSKEFIRKNTPKKVAAVNARINERAEKLQRVKNRG